LYAPDGEELGQTDTVDYGAPFVPAPAGYSMVRVDDDEPPITTEEPIIAFRIGDDYPEPYTLKGKAEGKWSAAIKSPDGSLTTPDGYYKNTEEFIASVVDFMKSIKADRLRRKVVKGEEGEKR
jgi:hypothetical protein